MSLLKNSVDPSFVNLMQAEITSDDSIIRHHYQHQNVWPGARRQSSLCNGMIWITLCKPTLPPSHFFMPASQTQRWPHALHRCRIKTQISLWWLRSLIRRSAEGILLKASQRAGEGSRCIELQSVLMSLLLSVQVLFTLSQSRRQYRSQSFPLRRCDLLLAFVCVSAQRFKLHREKFIPGSRGSAGSPVICNRYPKSSDCEIQIQIRGRFILKHDGNVLD